MPWAMDHEQTRNVGNLLRMSYEIQMHSCWNGQLYGIKNQNQRKMYIVQRLKCSKQGIKITTGLNATQIGTCWYIHEDGIVGFGIRVAKTCPSKAHMNEYQDSELTWQVCKTWHQNIKLPFWSLSFCHFDFCLDITLTGIKSQMPHFVSKF